MTIIFMILKSENKMNIQNLNSDQGGSEVNESGLSPLLGSFLSNDKKKTHAYLN